MQTHPKPDSATTELAKSEPNSSTLALARLELASSDLASSDLASCEFRFGVVDLDVGRSGFGPIWGSGLGRSYFGRSGVWPIWMLPICSLADLDLADLILGDLDLADLYFGRSGFLADQVATLGNRQTHRKPANAQSSDIDKHATRGQTPQASDTGRRATLGNRQPCNPRNQ